jgi:hypothetical protein
MMTIPTASAMTAEIFVAETGTPYLRAVFVQTKAGTGTVIKTTPEVPKSKQPPQLSYDAEWLSVVQQRIIASIPTNGYSVEGNTAWLQPEVAGAALEFFKRTSTALPGEPYLYSSQAGDLVAEFPVPCGKMTCIISPKVVLVCAVTDGEVVQKKLMRNQHGPDTLRSVIQEVTNLFHAGTNGKVGSRR